MMCTGFVQNFCETPKNQHPQNLKTQSG